MPVINCKYDMPDYAIEIKGPDRIIMTIEQDGETVGIIKQMNLNISLDMKNDGLEYVYCGEKYIEIEFSALIRDNLCKDGDFDIRLVRDNSNTLFKNCRIQQFGFCFHSAKSTLVENCKVVAESMENNVSS